MSDSYDERDYMLSGRHLWRSVLHRAIQEANGVDLIRTSKRQSLSRIQKEAREWLTDAAPALLLPVLPACDVDDGEGASGASGEALRDGVEGDSGE